MVKLSLQRHVVHFLLLLIALEASTACPLTSSCVLCLANARKCTFVQRTNGTTECVKIVRGPGIIIQITQRLKHLCIQVNENEKDTTHELVHRNGDNIMVNGASNASHNINGPVKSTPKPMTREYKTTTVTHEFKAQRHMPTKTIETPHDVNGQPARVCFNQTQPQMPTHKAIQVNAIAAAVHDQAPQSARYEYETLETKIKRNFCRSLVLMRRSPLYSTLYNNSIIANPMLNRKSLCSKIFNNRKLQMSN